MYKLKNTLIALMIIGAALSLNACIVVRGTPNFRPPLPSHNLYHYWYYYPNTGVYYHITDHYYYYPYHGTWRRANRLPDGWVLHNEGRVRLRISGVPYSKHAEHQRRYPPHNASRPHRGKDSHREREHRNTDHDRGHHREHGPKHTDHGVNREYHGREHKKYEMPPGHERRELHDKSPQRRYPPHNAVRHDREKDSYREKEHHDTDHDRGHNREHAPRHVDHGVTNRKYDGREHKKYEMPTRHERRAVPNKPPQRVDRTHKQQHPRNAQRREDSRRKNTVGVRPTRQHETKTMQPHVTTRPHGYQRRELPKDNHGRPITHGSKKPTTSGANRRRTVSDVPANQNHKHRKSAKPSAGKDKGKHKTKSKNRKFESQADEDQNGAGDVSGMDVKKGHGRAR